MVGCQITTPYTFIAALNKDVYRKPDLGMWELIREKNGDVKLGATHLINDTRS